ncbi:hypothetical protein PX52LOC_06571 [Limnoglobus roseus]|uniref:Uncharacterized protein n=2 Tax=Limnoglobus roseus TaxID=2598579 RepID=A0A5C1AMY0_9BACT|nr:hypothetical protein PX52LOC_06571 [Limnoglobus roseus]
MSNTSRRSAAAHSDLYLAFRTAYCMAALADGAVLASRMKSFRVFQINLSAIRLGLPDALGKIAPVRKYLDDVSTYPLATSAHIGAVQFADRVSDAVRLAIPGSVQIEHADRAGLNFLTWYPTDDLIEQNFSRVAKRIGRHRWPNTDRIVTECQRERSRAIAKREQTPAEHELAVLARTLKMGRKEGDTVRLLAKGDGRANVEEVAFMNEWPDNYGNALKCMIQTLNEKLPGWIVSKDRDDIVAEKA